MEGRKGDCGNRGGNTGANQLRSVGLVAEESPACCIRALVCRVMTFMEVEYQMDKLGTGIGEQVIAQKGTGKIQRVQAMGEEYTNHEGAAASGAARRMQPSAVVIGGLQGWGIR